MSTPGPARSSEAPSAVDLLSVGLISAAAIFYEILLMRLLSVIHWHQFAWMIISLALLGIGASGTFLTLFREVVTTHFRLTFSLLATSFGASAVLCYAVVQTLPFNSLEAAWNPRQFLYLLLIYVLLALPFFCAGSCIGAALMSFRDAIGRVYQADLLGAGAGAALVIPLLSILSLTEALNFVGVAGTAAGALAIVQRAMRVRKRASFALFALALVVAGVILTADPLRLRMSQFKHLAQALLVPGTTIVEQRSSGLGLLTVVESRTIPFRHVPGMSLNYGEEPPDQVGVFTDGSALDVITRYDGTDSSASHLDFVTTAVAYHLRPRSSVLVLAAGGGMEVLSAKVHGASQVDAVELNPQMTSLVKNRYDDFAGGLYRSSGTRLFHSEARAFLAATDSSYDVIQATPRAGAAAAENYLYTTEGIRDIVQHLRPRGVAVISTAVDVPPRSGLRLFATAVAALGAEAARDQLALIRSWGSVVLLIRNGPFPPDEIVRLREFCSERSFDVDYAPGVSPSEANQFNVLEESYYHDGAMAILSRERERFFDSYKFNVSPTSDDRPYFSHFLKWRVIPELLALRGRGGMPLVEWGYLIVVATVVQAVFVSAILILLPLLVLRRRTKGEAAAATRGRAAGVAIYFLLLGLAFLFVEIAFVHRFTFFLGNPLYAVSVVIAGFLIFAGIGSGSVARLQAMGEKRRVPIRRLLTLVAVAIALLATLYEIAAVPLLAAMVGQAGMVKMALAVVLIAPLAFLMGMPFPIGLQLVGTSRPAFLPWAWGINGSASVVSAVLASLVAIHFGFTVLVVLAAMMYVAAGIVAKSL